MMDPTNAQWWQDAVAVSGVVAGLAFAVSSAIWLYLEFSGVKEGGPP